MLAGDLARLMDDMVTRQVPWDRLKELVPLDVDEHWQDTLEFLQDRVRPPGRTRSARCDRIEPAERRNRLIEAEAARLANSDRAGDRRGLDRLDPGDRRRCSQPSRSCRTAPWCCQGSTPTSNARPGT